MLAESKPYEWVVYDPPKSVSFGHQARVKDARRAWKLTEEFLNQQADFALGHHLDLTYYEPTQEADASVASARLAAARAVLGPETSAQPNCLRWKIQPDQLPAAIDFALDDEKFPLWAWHPTNLHLYYLFTWKHFDLLLAPNETRDVRSTLGVTIGGGSVFLQPRFVFPAAWSSEIFRTLLVRIEPASPFRFRDQYFKRWFSPVRKGGFGRSLKLAKDWRSTWES